MSNEFSLDAEIRSDAGKGASRRLRRLQDKLPAIIYGGKKEPQSIQLELRSLVKALENEAFYSHIITLNVAGKSEQAILRDLQRHPATGRPLHADFQRIDAKTKLHAKVPLHFINEDICTGVKDHGGVITHNMSDLEVSCLPKDLPEFIEVDLEAAEIGTTIHISDLTLPKGVESVQLSHGSDHDHPVVAVNKPKRVAVEEEDTAAGEEAAEGDAAE